MGGTDAFHDPSEAPCGRCRRLTPADQLTLWTTRERLRTLARQSAPSSQPATAAAVRPRLREPALTADAPHAEPVAPRPPAAFRYASRTRVDAVCPECWGRLTRGAALDGPERRRITATLLVFLAVAALILWGIPTLAPNLVAAFWRNGAGGR